MVGFGHEFKSVDAFITGKDVGQDKKLLDSVAVLLARRFGLPRLLWGPLLGFWYNGQHVKNIKAFFRTLIEALRSKASTGSGNETGMNVMQRLVHAKNFSDEEIESELIGFFEAGHETTANAMASCLYELSMNPVVQDKLYTEIKSICGGCDVSYESLDKFK